MRATRQTCVQRRAALAGFITQNSCGGYRAANHGVNDQTTMPAAASAPSHTVAPLGPSSAVAEPIAAPRYTYPAQGRSGNTASLCWLRKRFQGGPSGSASGETPNTAAASSSEAQRSARGYGASANSIGSARSSERPTPGRKSIRQIQRATQKMGNHGQVTRLPTDDNA